MSENLTDLHKEDHGRNARKVNCGREYSSYILKPVLFGICKQE